MLFNSLHFLLFFPIVCLLYFLLPHRFRWVWLLLTSYYFYMSWNVKYALLMAISAVTTYASGLLIEKANGIEDERKSVRQKKIWVALCFVINLGILFFFKYFTFAVESLNRVFSVIGIPHISSSLNVLLPVGISFYTFQALSYCVDVYRGEVAAERNLGKYALFVSFFPQLVAGPIERTGNLLHQINEKHSLDYDRIKRGLLMMLWGYFQKLVIADRAAGLVNQVYTNFGEYGGLALIVATLLFAVQIYCDFSGYSYIAIGAAKVMGFTLMDNFKQPYFSLSIRDFWRRWHISLSTWFRDYLYIPMGGNRGSKAKKYRNLIITFLASGLWHGASWNYVIWGGLHGGYQIIGEWSKPWRKRVLAFFKVDTSVFSYRLLQGVVTVPLVTIAWIFFRASDAGTALAILGRIATAPWKQGIGNLGMDSTNMIVLGVFTFILFVVENKARKNDLIDILQKQNLYFRWTVYYLLAFSVLIFGVFLLDTTQAQFIYFQF